MTHRRDQNITPRVFESELASLIKSMFGGRDYGPSLVAPSAPKPRLNNDPNEYVDLLRSLCVKLRNEGFSAAFHIDIQLQKFHEKGEFHLRTNRGGNLEHVYVRILGPLPSFGCSCEKSQGKCPCEHILACCDWLCRQILNTNCDIRTRIQQGSFDAGKPDYSEIKYDRGLVSIRTMQALVNRVETYQPADVSLPEPPIAKTVEERVVWCFHGELTRLLVTPMVQSKKKTGNGFTKGKRTSLEMLSLNYQHCLDAQDRKLLTHAVPSMQARNSSMLISPYQALTSLIGSEKVLYNDEPTMVCEKPIQFAVANSSQGFGFCIADGVQVVPSRNVAIGNDCAFYHDTDSHQIVRYDYSRGLNGDIVQDLLSIPPVGKEHWESFLATAKELQKRFPIKLPQDSVGKFVTDVGKPMILLRARADGRLDYGLRTKIQTGQICVPGGEPSVYLGTIDGKTVQYIRDAHQEISATKNLAEQLEVEAQEWGGFSGTIESFEDGISLLEQLEQLRDHVEILWDKQSEKPIRMVGAITAKNLRVDIASKRNWFGITGECKLKEETVPLEQLLDNLNGTANPVFANYIQVGDGQWARIEKGLREKLELLRDATHLDRKSLTLDATAAKAIQGLSSIDVEVKAAKSWQQCMQRFTKSESIDPQLPKGLQADLRDYQVEGFKWLRKLAEWGVGGILADDMGLGKTLQTLAVLLDRAHEGPALVIAPTSVGFNWIRETQRFAPDLNVMPYRESDRQTILAGLKPGDVVVSSYALAWRDEAELSKIEWGTLVMDEAQAIKNARSKTSQAVSNFNSKWSIALTGTPMENHLGELWSLFSVVSPGVLGGWESFRKRYATPIERQNDQDARKSLSNRLRPFILRRTKEEVLTELPPRTESVLYVDLSPEERSQYELVRRSAIGEIENIALLPEIKDQRFKILALLTRLRQFACHPGIVNKQWDRSSAKLDQLCETLGNLKEEGHRALIFSQFTEHLGLIRKALDERGFTYQYLDGSTPVADRQQRVDDFQNGTDTAFLISLKAGGTGLNLTAADYVIHMDPWWNPAVEDQATDRAHRFGQDKPVIVYRIVAKGTIEEEILALHEHKRDLVEGILEGTGAAAKLSTSDLMQMIQDH